MTCIPTSNPRRRSFRQTADPAKNRQPWPRKDNAHGEVGKVSIANTQCRNHSRTSALLQALLRRQFGTIDPWLLGHLAALAALAAILLAGVLK